MEKLLRAVYASEKKKKCLNVCGRLSVYINVVIFAAVLAVLALGSDPLDAAIAALSAAIGYLTVTLARKKFNRPRPYEVYDFYAVRPREKQGESFPSRHCYSAFVITSLSWLVCPFAVALLFILALLIATSRVLLGIHFVRDVVCGALIGILFGICGVALATVL